MTRLTDLDGAHHRSVAQITHPMILEGLHNSPSWLGLSTIVERPVEWSAM